MNPKKLRKKIAKGNFNQSTAGFCNGYVQANMIVLPEEYAKQFEEFANKNSKAIPILEIVKGSHYSKVLAPGANLLNELPAYNIIKNGELVSSVENINEFYTNDLVFFLVGCSFTFENSLINNNIKLRHVKKEKNVSMYNTNIKLKSYNIFDGEMVVSMRPIKKDRVADACVITSHYPNMHGSPIHIGYPQMIGIEDINNPDYGDSIEIKDDEIPVFWPCGVTPENVLKKIKLPFAITHKPGHMFVSDKKDSEFYE